MTMDRRCGWWREFFSGVALDFIRLARDEEQTAVEMEFVRRALGLPSGARVLDVPCGAGRLSLALAAAGCDVTGVDFSQPLLDCAGAKSGGAQVRWECRDMRELPWRDEFDGAVCAWNSFGYFDDAGNAAFLQAVSQALKPGAPFVLDTPVMETWIPQNAAESRAWWKIGDMLALEEHDFDCLAGRLKSEWTFIRDGRMETKGMSLRLYTFRELVTLLEGAGFGGHRAYGGLDFEPFGLGAEWLYMVTTKLSAKDAKAH